MQLTSTLGNSVFVCISCVLRKHWHGVYKNTTGHADEQIGIGNSHKGVNFIDTAEMYPCAACRWNLWDYRALHRKLVGSRNPNKREKLIYSYQNSGSGVFPYVRVMRWIEWCFISDQAIDDSLSAIQTDYIDVYQLHWPNRISGHTSRKHCRTMLMATQQNVKLKRTYERLLF